jgi:hypothetical protein
MNPLNLLSEPGGNMFDSIFEKDVKLQMLKE